MAMFDEICFGCGSFIDDPYYLMLAEHRWHLSCLKCFDCGLSLEHEKTCFIKNRRILCKNDYIKKSSSICKRCHERIHENDLIFRVKTNLYHFDCFTCVICQNLLHSEDEFGIKDNHIYCREHLFDQQLSNRHVIHDDSGYHTSPNEARHSKINDQQCFSYLIENDENQSIGLAFLTKQKRLRTSFKLHQLRFLRSYFNLNHNPDAKELKSLSEKTNLSKRVLQVWFQNARAKYRRSHISSRNDKLTNIEQLETCNSPL